MARVDLLSGQEALTAQEFSDWDERELRESSWFVDGLRRRLAAKLSLLNFRQLALVCGKELIQPGTPWSNYTARPIVAVIRHAEDRDNQADVCQTIRHGDVKKLQFLLDKPVHPDMTAGRWSCSRRSDRGRLTPMLAAAVCGHAEVLPGSRR